MLRRFASSMMRPTFRPAAIATRAMATHATKLVVSVIGPSNQLALSNFTRTINGQGALSSPCPCPNSSGSN